MREDVMQGVSLCRRPGSPARLSGYCRRIVSGQDYPGIFPCMGGRVEGVVYRNVPEKAWRRLDSFEGRMYVRRSVSIRLPGGARLRTQVYVVKPAYRRRLARCDWDVEHFLANGQAGIGREYPGWR